MTIISILNDDWEIAFADETVGTNAVAGLRSIRHVTTGGSPTLVRTSNAFYSAVADAMDEHAAMDFANPMLPTTPEAYTIEAGYFVPNLSMNFLQGGAMSTVAQGSNQVCSIAHNNSTPFVDGDIGRQVVGGTTTDTGTLLDFETLPDGTTIIWIRPDDPATDLFDDPAETLSTVADGGTGNATSTAVSSSGEQLWSNIQVIGGVASNSEVYVVQDRVKLAQWWTTDPTASLGIIDILVRVQRDGVLISNGELEVFSRRYTALYDNFLLDVSGGGRSALPLATADDPNNNTGYRAAVWSSGTGSAMLVGDLLTNTTQVGAFAIVTAVTDSGATGTFEYYLVGDLNDFVTTNTFTSPNRNGTINGAPTANLLGPTDVTAGEGGTVTIALGTRTFDHDGDGSVEPYSMEVDAQGDVSQPKVYERIKYACRRGAPNTDLFGAGVNLDGEQFRGAQAQIQYDNLLSGPFGEGEDIFETAATYTAVNLATNTGDTYLMISDPFDVPTLIDNDQLQDEGGSTVDVMGAPVNITPVKASPFGTSTGTQLFGSRGVLYSNPAVGDEQNYINIDDNGIRRTPPNTVSVEITGLEIGDVVFVADDNATAGVIDRDRFGGMAVTSEGATSLAGLTIDSDVPQVGYLRVVDITEQEEHSYRYSARTAVAFTLVETAGVADAGGSGTLLEDAAGGFIAADVQPGDRIFNITDGADVAFVVSVTDADTLVTTQLVGGGSNDWATGDSYEIGRVRTNTGTGYTTSDNVFAPIIDRAAVAGDSGSISNSLVQLTSFGVVVNVRQGKIILPFTQNGTVGSTGLSLAAIRNLDTIAT